MRQQAIKWWKHLSQKDREKYIKDWKKSPGLKEDDTFKEWPDNLIMMSTSIIQKIFVWQNNSNS